MVGIIYAYHEKDADCAANLRFFLDHGYISGHTFVVVVNGTCSVDMSAFVSQPNFLRVDRDNKGYDFGAYAAGLEALGNRGIACAEYIFLNTSCRGPFIPPYAARKIQWPAIFVDLLNSDTKLVGPSINVTTPVEPFAAVHPHVQTYCFAMDSECMEYLVSLGFWRDIPDDYHRVIVEKEMGMSALVLRRGWNIDCLVPEYSGQDYRAPLPRRPFNPWAGRGHGDMMWSGNACFGRDVHPYEMVFFKANRDLGKDEVPSLTRALAKS